MVWASACLMHSGNHQSSSCMTQDTGHSEGLLSLRASPQNPNPSRVPDTLGNQAR